MLGQSDPLNADDKCLLEVWSLNYEAKYDLHFTELQCGQVES